MVKDYVISDKDLKDCHMKGERDKKTVYENTPLEKWNCYDEIRDIVNIPYLINNLPCYMVEDIEVEQILLDSKTTMTKEDFDNNAAFQKALLMLVALDIKIYTYHDMRFPMIGANTTLDHFRNKDDLKWALTSCYDTVSHLRIGGISDGHEIKLKVESAFHSFVNEIEMCWDEDLDCYITCIEKEDPFYIYSRGDSYYPGTWELSLYDHDELLTKDYVDFESISITCVTYVMDPVFRDLTSGLIPEKWSLANYEPIRESKHDPFWKEWRDRVYTQMLKLGYIKGDSYEVEENYDEFVVSI